MLLQKANIRGFSWTVFALVAIVSIVAISLSFITANRKMNNGVILEDSSLSPSDANLVGSAIKACKDSDGGLNYYTRGQTNIGRYNVSDRCIGSNTLIEFFCQDSGKTNKITYKCPNGCKDGACINVEKNELCKPLYEDHNSLSGERFNFVFEGVGYRNMDELLQILKTFIDLNPNDSGQGLLGQEPFKSNKNLFNFWYIDNINECYDIFNPDCQPKAIEFYYYCNFTHKYYVRLFDTNLVPWIPNLNVTNQNDLYIWTFNPQMTGFTLNNTRDFLLHEFGHLFQTNNLDPKYAPLLLDEYDGRQSYINYSWVLRDSPWAGKIIPNIFVDENVHTIEECKQKTHWKDLIGNGCGAEGIIDCISVYTPPSSPTDSEVIICESEHPDCYKEVSCFEGGLLHTKGAFRPTFDSIMKSTIGSAKLGYNLPSQRHLCRIIKSELGTCKGVCEQFITCS